VDLVAVSRTLVGKEFHTSKKSKVKSCIAVNVYHSYGVSLAIWDHTVLPSTRHKRTHPAFTPARQAGT